MIEEFKSASWNDFNQRYKGTFGWFLTETGSKRLVQLKEISSRTATFIDKSGREYTANSDRGNCFEFLPIERALYNYKDAVYYCSRKTERQWRRGICFGNTNVRVLSGFPVDGSELSFYLVDCMFNGDNYSEPIRRFKSGNLKNVALSSMFALIKNKIYLFDRDIGVYKELEKELILANKLFHQEVSDVLRDCNLNLKVVVL